MYISRRVVDIVCCAEAKYKSILLPNHVQRLDHFSPLSLFLSVSLVAHQQLTKWNKPSYNYQHEYDTFFPLSPPKNAVDNDLLAEDHPPIAEIKCKQHRIMNQFFFCIRNITARKNQPHRCQTTHNLPLHWTYERDERQKKLEFMPCNVHVKSNASPMWWALIEWNLKQTNNNEIIIKKNETEHVEVVISVT